MNLQGSVVINEPSLRNLFMNKLARDLVVPIISASVSWLIFAMTGSALTSFPKFAIKRRTLARRFSLELKKLVDQVLLNAGVPS